ncbi:MAG: tetratricopeptide repeat protein [Planctomycetes bacterium]|nr:tetratricopeptide repeat protein [Planctomycetota bacterium]
MMPMHAVARCALVRLLLVLLLCGAAGSAAAQTTEASRALREAQEALDRGEAGRAAILLEEALRRDPGAVEAMELLASAYDRAGRADDARATGERVLRAFPERTAARLWFAQLLEKQRAFGEAEPHYDQVVQEAEPGLAAARAARLGLARVRLERGAAAAAREALAPLLGAEPDDAAAELEVRALRADGQLDPAIAAARSQAARVPAMARALASLLHERGMVAFHAGDLETAGRCLAESAALEPGVRVELDLAEVLGRQGRRGDALAVLRQAAARPRSDLALGLAGALCAAGGPEDALALVREVLGGEPDSRAARLLELRCLGLLARGPELRQRLEALVPSLRGDAEWQTAVLLAVRDLADLPQHVALLLERDFRAEPAAAATWIHLLRRAGRTALGVGDTAGARRFLGEARRLAPEEEAIGRELGWVELAAERPEEALRLWQTDLEASDAPADLLAAAARCHHAAGRLEEALSLSRRACAAAPESPEIRRFHWRLLDEAGLGDELAEAVSPERVAEPTPEDCAALASLFLRRCDEPPLVLRLEQWLDREPGSAELARAGARVFRDRARTAKAWGESDRALALARRAVALAPEAAWTHRELASLLAERGDHEGALDACRQALRLEPASVSNRVRLLDALRAAGQLEEAAEVAGAAPESTALDRRFLLAAVQLQLARDEPERARDLARRLVAAAKEARDDRAFERGHALLVSCLLKAGDYESALAALEEAIRQRPGDSVRLERYRAACLWHGAERRFRSFLGRIERTLPRELAILTVLANHHMERQDHGRAVQALERCVVLAPDDPTHWNHLGRAELERGNTDAARRAFERAAALAPHATWPRLGLAEAESQAGRHARVLELADEILAENPWLQPALWMKVRAFQRLGETDAALRTWDSMYGFLVDEPEHYLMRARILYGGGRLREARTELEQVLARCATGVLPILVYHGVSDDMQPATIHAARLRDHFRALRDAGYVTIGQQDVEAWLAGERALPERAILITFDDARLDNLQHADPALREFRFKAVQFVPTARIEARRTFHMSWDDLRALLASGRWEVGAHGHRAHDRVDIDAAGASSPFLAARRWRKGEQRLETREEYAGRIEEDYRACKEALEHGLGLERVPFYAFSFNDFGQSEVSNAPWIFEANEQALTRHYRRGLHQSGGAYNIRTETGTHYLARLSVPLHWSGEELVESLRRSHPGALTRLELGRLLTWTGDYRRGLQEIELAEQAGAEEAAVLKARASGLLWRGDAVAAGDTFRRLLDLDPGDARSLELFERTERDRRPSVKATCDYWWDSEGRSLFGQTLRGDVEAARRLRLFGALRSATYRDRDGEKVQAWIPRIGAEASLEGPTELEASIGQSFLAGAKDQVDYTAAVRWQGIDRFALVADVAGGAVQTASAMVEGIRLDAQSVLARYLLSLEDQVDLSFRNAVYSDGNRRQTVRFRYTHRLSKSPAVHVGYVGTYDDTRDGAPEYYTPDNLHQHLVRVRVDADLAPGLTVAAQLAGGYGVEDGDGRFVGQGLLRLIWRVSDRVELFGELSHERSPDYHAGFVSAGLDVRF